MIHSLQRHPKYVVLLVVLVVGSFLYLSAPYPTHDYTASLVGFPGDTNLPARVERAEKSYRRVVEKRQELIKKHGPSSSQVVMFPPDQDPWPAYTVWDFFPPAFNCPHELERVGTLGDGGKWTCGVSRVAQKPDCTVYSFGMDWDSAWEAAVLDSSESCEIWGYDHAMKGFGRHVSHASFTKKHRTHFQTNVQLGPEDKHDRNDDPKLYTLETIMRQNGHTFIDILKVDIEGYEFDTLKAMLQPYVLSGKPLPFGQLQIELHVWGKKFPDFLNWWETLEAAGLRPVMMEPNLVYVNYNRASGAELAEYTFLNIKGNNVFIADPPASAPADGEPDPKFIRHGPRD
ncbi:methyltransferase domain-containing protein [Phanerochaete sordida]|uniref:Methyltransferase domain-containing protein n=1 Tax=Phanerochaete sordida TaxID=48140 RepID=A0A9P3LIY8_9APHY|nr:methyltransferase domain-containing protein [Phanerochaete sordida]